jgi:hypothetical protein
MPHWTHSTSLNWIAAHIYFVWSPELMCIGLVVFVVGRWISAFTHAHQLHVSLRRLNAIHRKWLILEYDSIYIFILKIVD